MLPLAPEPAAMAPASNTAPLVEELAALRLENATLRAENAALQAHVRELEARLAAGAAAGLAVDGGDR